MTLAAALVATLVTARPAAGATRPDTVPPYVAFPDPALDDPTAYRGYATRVYRDARGNAVQVYLNAASGRVVTVWADALDESVGFTVRDTAGRPAAVRWASRGAAVGAAGATRWLAYALDMPAPAAIGLFLLGSMRVERDFQSAGRDSLPLDAPAVVEPALLDVIGALGALPAAERRRHLALLRARDAAELRARLAPRMRARVEAGRWVVRVDQPSFDGRHRLSLELAGVARETRATVSGAHVTVTSRAAGPARITVRIGTDAPALAPLGREEIFNDAFWDFYAAVRADTAHPLRFRRLEREVRGAELLSYREKVMAGLPNFATYFGRDMFMTALLMRPVWKPGMAEHVIASALRKLSPDGDVSHEEALGGEAIREHAAEYVRLVAAGRTAEARRVLARLAAPRENYVMVDDDFQLPVVVASYLADPRVPPARKRRFLAAEGRLARVVANLGFVARQAAPYARAPVPTNLVGFPRAPDGGWRSASWRDSRAGYGGGRFALDVNAIWVPHALRSVATILDALRALGLRPAITAPPLVAFVRDRRVLERAIAVWEGAERHFWVAVPDAPARVAARLAAMPAAERAYWEAVARRSGAPADTLRFLALALDAAGRPIPIVNTDPAMLLLLDTVPPERARALLQPVLWPYPWGLFVDGLGPLAANDAYAAPEVWQAFRRDPYHSPAVVWGRDVNILLAGLATAIGAARTGAGTAPLRDALARLDQAVERSGLRHAELWSYRLDGGRLVPERYGTGSDVQLWSLTDLAVQYLLAELPRQRP
jgi:hypothetical protein